MEVQQPYMRHFLPRLLMFCPKSKIQTLKHTMPIESHAQDTRSSCSYTAAFQAEGSGQSNGRGTGVSQGHGSEFLFQV